MTDFSTDRFRKLAGLLKEQSGDDKEMDDEFEAVSQRERDAEDELGRSIGDDHSEVPEGVMTVGELKKVLVGLSDDTLVAGLHEFGTINPNVNKSDDMYYKPEDYGGDWHYSPEDELHGHERGSEGRGGVGPFTIIVIG